MSGCVGICIKYKAKKIFGEMRYASGQKRCTHCGIFIYWDGKCCPCCGRQLKTSPQNSQDKAKFREALKQ